MNESGLRNMFDPERFRRPVIPEQFDGMVVNPVFKDFLAKIGFVDFERVFGFSGGHSFKKIRQRSVARIDFSVDGVGKTFYLKRHNAEKVRGGAESFSDFGAGSTSQGMLEFENIVAFRRHGLATVTPVAAGVRMVGRSRAESFLLTEDFSPWVSLEWLLFNRPEYFTGPGANLRKKALLEKIGRFARKMHDEGFNHKDFNATHILLGVGQDLRGPLEIALFDLQRVDRGKFFRFRWVIKSLAELNYTLFDEFFSDEDRALLFRAYKGTGNAGVYGRFQQFWIRRKSARIARHTQKLVERRRLRT